MKAPIIQIGNSKGLRLSKNILERYNIKEQVELIFEDSRIILVPIDEPRKGWSDAFAKMHSRGDDQSFMDDVFEDESFEEWK
jgi:antitoxin MazE